MGRQESGGWGLMRGICKLFNISYPSRLINSVVNLVIQEENKMHRGVKKKKAFPVCNTGKFLLSLEIEKREIQDRFMCPIKK
jgi:hypothetical protein